jgi:ankyrin repeat protein
VNAAITAAEDSQWDVVRAALDAGVPISTSDIDGCTLLCYASGLCRGLPDAEVVRDLLARGADPNAGGYLALTNLGIAMSYAPVDVNVM